MRNVLGAVVLGTALAVAGAASAKAPVLQGHTSDGQTCQITGATTGRSSASSEGGGVSTSITAGNGHVSGITSGPGGTIGSGQSVTVRFGNGEEKQATVTGSSAGSASGTTMIASVDGKDCIVSQKAGG